MLLKVAYTGDLHVTQGNCGTCSQQHTLATGILLTTNALMLAAPSKVSVEVAYTGKCNSR